MGFKRHIRAFCWHFGCGVTHCVNCLLVLLALGLVGLVLLNNLQTVVPMPDKLARWILQITIGDTYSADWTNAVFDLRGGLFLKNLKIKRIPTNDTLLDADTLRIDCSPINLLFGIFPPVTELSAGQVRLFVPASLSSSGLNEPVAQIHNVHLFEKEDHLILDNLVLQSGGLWLYGSGSAPLELLGHSPRAAAVSDKLNALLAKIQRLPKNMVADIQFRWQLHRNGVNQVEAHLLSDSCVLPMAHLKSLSATASFEFTQSALAMTRLLATASLVSLDPDALPKGISNLPLSLPLDFSLSADGPLVEKSFGSLPSAIQGVLPHHPLKNLPVRLALFNTSLLIRNPVLHWSLSDQGLFASGTARKSAPNQPDTSPQSLPVDLSFRLSLQQPVLERFLPNLPDIRLLQNARAGYIRINASSLPGQLGLSGILTADDLFVGLTHFANLHGNFTIRPSSLQLSRLLVQKSPSEFARGSYSQDFQSSRFSINAVGQAFPASLDSLLGSWWQPIFNHIQTEHPIPADVTVWGHWNQEHTLKSMSAVHGDGVVYRGIAVPQLEARIRSNRDWAYLERLEGHFAEGGIEGQIGWVQNLSDTVQRPMVLHLKSDAAWGIDVEASGVPGLEELDIPGRPRVEVQGIVWRPPRDKEPEEESFVPDLSIRLSQPEGPCRVSGLELDSLFLEGTIDQERLELNALTGTFANGVFTGTLQATHWQERGRRERHLQVQLFDADYGLAVHLLRGFFKQPAGLPSPLIKDTGEGRMDADLDLYLTSKLETSRGDGRLTLRKAPIGQIHIFGGLSKLLDGMGLGFSTLDLNAASMEWKLGKGIVDIRHCLVMGQVLNLDVTGNIDLVGNQLDLVADAYLFRGLISKVLTPVSDNFEFDLTGSLENPIWKLRLNPLRWFQYRLPKVLGFPAEP